MNIFLKFIIILLSAVIFLHRKTYLLHASDAHKLSNIIKFTRHIYHYTRRTMKKISCLLKENVGKKRDRNYNSVLLKWNKGSKIIIQMFFVIMFKWNIGVLF